MKIPDHVHEPHATQIELLTLIHQAQNGSQDAYMLLLGKYRPLIDASVARFVSADMSQQDREDMREEAERVFLNALITYDTDQDAVDFGLYAKICLRNGLISERRHLSSRRRFGVVSLMQDDISVLEDPSDKLVEEEQFRRLYRRVRAHLSEFENRIWWMFVAGVPVGEIARRLSKDEKSVHNAIYRIRRKLRKLLAPDEGGG